MKRPHRNFLNAAWFAWTPGLSSNKKLQIAFPVQDVPIAWVTHSRWNSNACKLEAWIKHVGEHYHHCTARNNCIISELEHQRQLWNTIWAIGLSKLHINSFKQQFDRKFAIWHQLYSLIGCRNVTWEALTSSQILIAFIGEGQSPRTANLWWICYVLVDLPYPLTKSC